MTDDGGAFDDLAKAFRRRKRTEHMHPIRAKPGLNEEIGRSGIAVP